MSPVPAWENVVALRFFALLGYLIMVIAILALFAHRSFFGSSALTITLQLLAVGLMMWARIAFGWRSFHLAGPTEGGLVTSGPYQWIRHPIYTSALVLVGAGVGAHISGNSLAWFGVFVAGVGTRIVAEERLVSLRYPDYTQYASRTKRLIPFIF